MNAIILAGGFGTRLMPFTASKPKPALSIANMPMIDYSVSMLYHYGINEISFALAHMPEKIIEWTLGYNKIKCHYNVESMPLGTCGAVKAMEDYLDQQFFVVSGDGICNIDLSKMLDRHRILGAEITMAITSVENPSQYGVVSVDNNGYIQSFIEKPKSFDGGSAYINCGVYIVNKSVLSSVSSNSFFDFSKDLFPLFLAQNRKIAVYFHDGYWSDVGSLDSYHKSNMDIARDGLFFDYAANRFRKHMKSKLINDSIISSSAIIEGEVKGSVIGANCRICKNVTIENCVILENADINNSYKNCIIDACYVRRIENEFNVASVADVNRSSKWSM